MERRHVLRGKLPGGGLSGEPTTVELTPAEKAIEVAKWDREVKKIERQIATAQRNGEPPMVLASHYGTAAHACMMLSYAMSGIRFDPNAARRNAERRLILDALGE